MTRIAIAAGALAALTGCGALTYGGRYDRDAFAGWRIAQDRKVDGRALILTTAGDDAFVYSARPTGTLGSATRLELPLGVITREAALRVFGELFTGGATASSDASRAEGCRGVISPRPIAFDHRYGWTTARFHVAVHVALLDERGQPLLEKLYDSGWLEAPRRHGERSAGRAIEREAHVAIQRLMLAAAADVKARLEGGARERAAGVPTTRGVASP